MKTAQLLIALAVTASVAGAGLAQQVPTLIPPPSTPTLPPRSDKIQVKPSDAGLNPTIPAASGEKLQQLGSQLADVKTSGEAKDMLSRLVNAATRENGFVEVVGYIAPKDRERIGDVRRENLDELHKAVARFREDFREKYKQEFALTPEHLKDAVVNVGADANTLTVSLSDLEKNSAVPPADKNLPSSLKPTDGISKDIPAHTGLSMVSGPVLNLVREGHGNSEATQWRVNIPDEISAKQLKENLTLHLRKLDDLKPTWSDDVNVTTRAAAAQVLQALNDSTLASDH